MTSPPTMKTTAHTIAAIRPRTVLAWKKKYFSCRALDSGNDKRAWERLLVQKAGQPFLKMQGCDVLL